jgi:hypothetical protein
MDRASLDPKALSGQKPERSALHRCRYRIGCECGTRRLGRFANRGAWLYRVSDRPKAEYDCASVVQRLERRAILDRDWAGERGSRHAPDDIAAGQCAAAPCLRGMVGSTRCLG